MAAFNFRATEDDRPGGGVYKLPGNGPTWTIKQSDYPEVNLSAMTVNNFFKRTVCSESSSASVHTRDYTNEKREYVGGKTSMKYSYANGVGTLSITSSNRSAYVAIDDFAGNKDSSGPKTAGYTHTAYMSRTPLI